MKVTTRTRRTTTIALGLTAGVAIASCASPTRQSTLEVSPIDVVAAPQSPAPVPVPTGGRATTSEAATTIRIALECTERRLTPDDAHIRVFEETCTYGTPGPSPYPAETQGFRIESHKDFESWFPDGSRQAGRCTIQGLCVFENQFTGTGEFEGRTITAEGGSYWPTDTTISGVITVVIE